MASATCAEVRSRVPRELLTRFGALSEWSGLVGWSDAQVGAGRLGRGVAERLEGGVFGAGEAGRDDEIDGDEQIALADGGGDASGLDSEHPTVGRARGMRMVTVPPSRVGTRMSAPNAASAKDTGTVSNRSSPSMTEQRMGPDATRT